MALRRGTWLATTMKLRAVVVLVALGLGLLTAPRLTQGQRVHRIGVLQSTISSIAGFREFDGLLPVWLSELGYVRGQNLLYEYRTAVETDEELPRLAAELVRLKVDLILAFGFRATRAAKQATGTIPIVMLAESDPVRAGLVTSLARPGGNITGFSTLVLELAGKRLELLKEAVPGLTRVAVLWNPADPDRVQEWKETQAAARALGVRLQSLEVRGSDDFESAFGAAAREQAEGLLVLADRLLYAHAQAIADWATRSRLPAMYPDSYFVEPGQGGLMSFGPDYVDLARRGAANVHKILEGTKAADLPVEQPMRFELVVNLKSAKALGLTIPPSVRIRVDRVIE